MKRAFATIFAGFLLLPNVLFAYTNPGTPTGFVNDYAGVLSAEQKQSLNAKLSNFEAQTGNEIAVVTIASLEGDTVENFAEKLFHDWGIGKKDKDNGALLLVAVGDREMRIEVGYGLEGDLTDLLSSRIIRETLTPAFQQGDFYGGINAATDQMIQIVGGNVPSELSGEADSSTDKDFIFSMGWLAFIGFLWLSAILGRSKSWWAGGIVGGVIGIILSLIFGFLFFGLVSIIVLIPLGLLFDYLVSKKYASSKSLGQRPPWWIGGGRGFGGGHGGGGFGGFGGGGSGGGGSSGHW